MPPEPLQSSSRMKNILTSCSPGSFFAPGPCGTSFHLWRPGARKRCLKFWSLLLSEWKLSELTSEGGGQEDGKQQGSAQGRHTRQAPWPANGNRGKAGSES